MRFHHLSEDLFGSQTSIRVLRTLVRFPQRGFTGREIAAESVTPPIRALETLRRLRLQGLVEVRKAGRSLVWTLRETHVMVKPLQTWFESERQIRERLFEKIRSTLAPLPFVRRVVVFGSVARGDERPDSDLDVLIVVDHEGRKDAALEAIRPLQREIQATFTNPLRPLIYDQHEHESKSGLAVVRNIRAEGIPLVEKQPIRTEKLEKSKAAVYLRKAEEFARLMGDAMGRSDWNAAGLGAVHAVISAADALTTAKLGIRSRERDHEEVVKLVRTVSSREAAARAEQALAVISLKNQVEYEARLFERADAAVVVKQAERFVAWVRAEMAR